MSLLLMQFQVEMATESLGINEECESDLVWAQVATTVGRVGSYI